MISFWKLLLLALVIAGVFVAVSIYKRHQRKQEIDAKRGSEKAPRMAHIQTVACRVCGTYVPERGAAKCARADCPV